MYDAIPAQGRLNVMRLVLVLSGEFFLWHISGEEAWPLPCPAATVTSDVK